jgi:hypothetical protein
MSEINQPVGDTSKKGARKSKGPSHSEGKKQPWTFPKITLEGSIAVPKAIEDKNGGNPMRASELAKAVGYRLSNDWRFLDLLRSANQYGIVTGSGANATISITKLGQDVVAPSSPTQRSEALLDAFRSVKDFAEVEKFYKGKRIPEDEFFLNTLTRDFKIPRDRVDQFGAVFTKNIEFLKAFSAGAASSVEEPAPEPPKKATPAARIPSPEPLKEPRTREFLDTCFVMMPFGQWFDRYYQEIYVPGIKDAGFEPVRADELFSTGSVMEQIWEQIDKAKILLADLSGKNPNVFYELGLSHAARKPVVFAASQVDDVPFDLRHLRVIIYDVREPDWAARLRKSVADYLRNAARDPEKSIPHPFRKTAED